MSALLSVSGADIHALAVENKIDYPVSGTLSANDLTCPVPSNRRWRRAEVEAVNVNAYGEHVDTVRGEITYSPTGIEVSSGELRSGTARIRGDVSYNHPANDWKDGSLALRHRLRSAHARAHPARSGFPAGFGRAGGSQGERRGESRQAA